MTKVITLPLLLVMVLFSGCEYQKRITAAEIGCSPKDIEFPTEDWAGFTLVSEYWEATCHGKRYACRPEAGMFVFFTAQNATCSEITTSSSTR